MIKVNILEHFLGNVEDDSRKECGTKEEQQFCGFVRVQKVITLHGWVVSTSSFTSLSFQQQHLHSLVCLIYEKDVFTDKCSFRKDMRKVLADKMKVSPPVCGVVVTKVTIKVSIITKL